MPEVPVALWGTDEALLPHTLRSNIPYEIESLSPRVNWITRASQQTINVRVKFADADTFIIDMVGRVYMAAPAGGGAAVLRRDLPEQHPQYANLWCTRVEQIDQGGGGDAPSDTSPTGPTRNLVTGWPEPLWMRFRCTYEGMPFALATDAQVDAAGGSGRELYRYVIRSRRPKVKEHQVPGGAMYVIPSGLTQSLLQPAFKRIVQADVQYVHVRVPVANLPLAAWAAAMGQYNDAAFDLPSPAGYEWPTATLLYLGYDDVDKYWDAAGNWVADVVHSFEYKQIGWNFFMTKSWTPAEVSSDGTTGGTRPYTGTDFTQLFVFT